MSSIGPRRGPHPHRSSRPDDLVAVAFDDAVLDRLAARSRRATSRGCPRWVSDAVTGTVPDLFAQWQDRLVEFPAPEPIGADRAAELVAVHARRPSVRPAIAIAAAICALLVGSAVVGAKSARPGDPLFPVTQVLWSDQAQSAVAGEKVRSVINAARAELAAGRPDHAAALLREASSGLNGISDRGDQAAVRRDLTAAWTLLAAVSPRLAATVSVTDPAAGGSGAAAGVGAPGGAAAPPPVLAGAAAPRGSGTFSSITEAALGPLGQRSGAGRRDLSGPGGVAASGPGSSRGSGGATSAGASSKAPAPASGTGAHVSVSATSGSPSSSTAAASLGASTSIAASPTTASAPPAVPVESSPAAGSSVPAASSTAATPTPPPSTAGVAPSSTLPTGAEPSSTAPEPSSPSVSNQAMILPGVPVVTVSGSSTSGTPGASSPGAPSPGSP